MLVYGERRPTAQVPAHRRDQHFLRADQGADLVWDRGQPFFPLAAPALAAICKPHVQRSAVYGTRPARLHMCVKPQRTQMGILS